VENAVDEEETEEEAEVEVEEEEEESVFEASLAKPTRFWSRS
jgi:hypothetical protein